MCTLFAVHTPKQDVDYDGRKAELCVPSYKPFWKRLPFAAAFVLAISTWSAMVKDLMSKALVLNKTTTGKGDL